MQRSQKKYVYLSVDQMQETLKDNKTDKKHSISEFFNIKFDINASLNETSHHKIEAEKR
jgi:hypothetical protein